MLNYLLYLTIIYLVFGILFFTGFNYAWVFGAIATILAQYLIFTHWKELKYLSIINIVIFIVAVFHYGKFTFHKLIEKEKRVIKETLNFNNPALLLDSDIAELPLPVKKWLRKCGAVGKNKTVVGKIEQLAFLKMKQDQKNWLKASATQYTTTEIPAFIWSVEVDMNPLIKFNGRDKFINGNGNMLIKINSLLTIVNEKGSKLNEATLQRYLGEMVWLPSLAVSPFITWEAIDERNARASMNFMGTTATGTFTFSENGNFEMYTALRYLENKPESKKYPWVLTVDSYSVFEGITVPSKMKATWQLQDSEWNWLRLEITGIKYNENVSW